MGSLVQSEKPVSTAQIPSSDAEEANLEMEFAKELSLLRKEIHSPRPQAVRAILNAFDEQVMQE